MERLTEWTRLPENISADLYCDIMTSLGYGDGREYR